MRPGFLQPGMKLLYRIILMLTWIFFKGVYRHRVYGLEHFYTKSAILAPNHTSFLDPPLVAISWPGEVHFLARESLFRVPLLGPLIRALNAHPVTGDASDIAVFKTVTLLLKEGKQLILFPEGTRSDDDALGVIKPGISLLIARANSAIIPTYVHGTFEIWGRERKFPKLCGKTACVFGSPILWESFAHLEKKEAQRALADRLFCSITALRSWYESGAEGIPP